MNEDQTMPHTKSEVTDQSDHPDKVVREFEGGSNRDNSVEKFEYAKFSNPINEYSFARYMHQHRCLPDGTIREPDNWERGEGMPADELIASLVRNVFDLELLWKGMTIYEIRDHTTGHARRHVVGIDGDLVMDTQDIVTQVTVESACNAIRFNSEALKLKYLMNVIKSKQCAKQ